MKTTSGLTLTGRIDTQVHNTSVLMDTFDDWSQKSKKEKLYLAREVTPVSEETVYNVTTERLHEYFVDNLDPDNTGVEASLTAAFVGLGTGGTPVAKTDTDLNNRVYSEQVTDHADNGTELLSSTFLDSTEGNGNVFDELGLFTGDPTNLSDSEVFLMNHVTFSPVTKDNTKTVTFDVTLSFDDI